MDAGKKIRIICDVDFLKSHLCAPMPDSERNEIIERYENKTALVIGFLREDETLFVAVFKLSKTQLLIDHVYGNWGVHFKTLDAAGLFLASLCGYKEVAFLSERMASKRLAMRAGYEPSPELEFSFVKRV